MSPFADLHSVLANLFGSRTANRSRAKTRSTRLCIERLEVRWAPAIDLVPYTVIAPTSAATGSTISAIIGESNYGNSPSGSHYDGIYASNDRVITTGDILLKSVLRPSLNGWSSQSWTENVTLPSWMTGTWTIGVIVDPWNGVSESNEWNNAAAAWSSTTITMPTQIDLAPTFVSAPTTAAPGSSITVQVGGANNGNGSAGPFTLNFYASSDANITTSDVLLKSVSRSGIGGWSSQSWTENVTLPSWMTGTWTIGVIVDPWNGVSESNEWNNARAASNSITISAVTSLPFTVDSNLNGFVSVTGAQLQAAMSAMRPNNNGLLAYAQTFVDVARTLNINPYYIAAHAAWETGWGTSSIFLKKNNPFGYGAYDKSPYDSAISFNSVADGVSWAMTKIKQDYLTQGGRFYNGSTLHGMNVLYATDPNWANGIVGIMNSLRNRVTST
jgi:beta-N-acetylglucosaminidase